ncbi:hypothetical protein BDW59DRAFT_114798 [Aspergillus cavernicola]|uniref:Uncharacterized protein n=1 Tax=Aspergillus cavernicola TaxID=176166 RepID=A0ABR4IWJ5_9EURO
MRATFHVSLTQPLMNVFIWPTKGLGLYDTWRLRLVLERRMNGAWHPRGRGRHRLLLPSLSSALSGTGTKSGSGCNHHQRPVNPRLPLLSQDHFSHRHKGLRELMRPPFPRTGPVKDDRVVCEDGDRITFPSSIKPTKSGESRIYHVNTLGASYRWPAENCRWLLARSLLHVLCSHSSIS